MSNLEIVESPIYKNLNSKNLIEHINLWRDKHFDLIKHEFVIVAASSDFKFDISPNDSEEYKLINKYAETRCSVHIDSNNQYVQAIIQLCAPKTCVMTNLCQFLGMSKSPEQREWFDIEINEKLVRTSRDETLYISDIITVYKHFDEHLHIYFNLTTRATEIQRLITWLISTKLLYITKYHINDTTMEKAVGANDGIVKYYLRTWPEIMGEYQVENTVLVITPPKYINANWFQFTDLDDNFRLFRKIRNIFDELVETYALRDKTKQSDALMTLLGL